VCAAYRSREIFKLSLLYLTLSIVLKSQVLYLTVNVAPYTQCCIFSYSLQNWSVATSEKSSGLFKDYVNDTISQHVHTQLLAGCESENNHQRSLRKKPETNTINTKVVKRT
jgi:hypothetical protein